MAWKRFDYLLQTDRKQPGNYVLRPVLEVEVFGPKGSAIFTALVDSGTEVTMLDAEIAESLGIDRSKCEPGEAIGVGGSKSGFISEITLKIEKFEDTMTTTVLFVDNFESDMLLGQQDFFNRFIVKFERANKKFYLDLA